MSGFSFSHQFYKHWLDAPVTAQQAIIQELLDISNLLQPQTVLSEFNFQIPDLNVYLDNIFAEHFSRLQHDRQAIEALAAHIQSDDYLSLKDIDNKHISSYQQDFEDSYQATPSLTYSAIHHEPFQTTTYLEDMDMSKQQAVINDLENRLDTYLNQQMSLISDEIKTWLRSEVKRHLQQK